jgi:alkylation response protein AidB-like acyl-CoA dehydrogenase
MNFELTEEQQKFREEIHNFCQTTPYGEIDARIAPDFSPEFYRKVATKGWLGLIIPKGYGGQGRSAVEGTMFIEEMLFHRAPISPVLNGHNTFFIGGILLRHGSESQKRYYLPRIARGDIDIGQSFTEAGGGSNLLSNTTRAVREGDHYIINGAKTFNSWAHKGQYLREYGISEHALLLAQTDQSARPDKSLSLFIFDATTLLPGMNIRPIMTIGGARTNEVFFDDVRIPAESLVGEENQAWDYVVESGAFYWVRGIGQHVGEMRRLFEELIQYVKETRINGQLLSKDELVRQKLAKLAAEIEGLRLHAYRLAWAIDEGLDITGLAAVMKFQSDRVQLDFFNSAMQILGPYGQLEGASRYAPLHGTVEAFYKAGIMRSFSSTGPSAMVNVIAGYVLGLPNEFGLIY